MNLERVIALRTNKTVYRDDDKAIKLFGSGYSKSDVMREALCHAVIEETELNVPKIIEVTGMDSKWAVITEYIPGKTLERLMHEHPEKNEEYMECLLDVQLEIHSQKADGLPNMRYCLINQIKKSPLDASTRYALLEELDNIPEHDKLCHGHLDPSNIIITPQGTPYILDWAYASTGNGAADAARAYLLMSYDGKTELAEKYLRLYCRKSDTAIQYIRKWIPIVAASQLIKCKSAERDFLMKRINIVEY